jgi:hypothetical protein
MARNSSNLMLSTIILSVVMLRGRYNKCHCPECDYAQSRYAECHDVRCCYAEVPLC